MSDLLNAICDILLAICLLINLYKANQTEKELDKTDEKLNKLLNEQEVQVEKELDKIDEKLNKLLKEQGK